MDFRKNSVFVMPFGKFSGTAITRVPVSYLRWMVCNKTDYFQEAQNELDRRGTVLPDLDISNHAIDRFSLRYLDLWINRDDKSVGIYAFLLGLTQEAAKAAKKQDLEKVLHKGITFVFDLKGCSWPVLKTVL